MLMRDLTIKFVDFWRAFDAHNNIFTNVLRKRYNITVLDDTANEEPQLLFYSIFGSTHLRYNNCIKIYFTGENDVPDFNLCDYALSAQLLHLGERHMRLPQYLFYDEYEKLNDIHPIDSSATERPFGSVVVSNSTYVAPERNTIIDAIEQYKPLAYGGSYRNNVGGRVPDKMAFIKQYKFNVALENSIVDGYTTEKIVEPMAAGTVPIYWGNKYVSKEFNPEAFINIADYDSYDRAIDAIARIDNDREAYLKMLSAPKILSECRIDWQEKLSDFLSNIVEKGRRHTHLYGIMGHIDYMRQRKELLYSNKLLRKCAGLYIKLHKKG